MRMIGRRRQVGGVAGGVAVFWLGFVCGGGAGHLGAAAIQDPAGVRPQEAPAVQPPAAPASASDEQPPAAPSESEVQAGPIPDAEPRPAPSPVRSREFTADVGVVLYFVRPEGESAFEETTARAAEALAASDSDERRRQAEGWSIWRAEEPLADGVILYVSWLDPVVPGADYWVPGILNEAFPTEAQALYETYAGAFADGQILLNLTPVAGP